MEIASFDRLAADWLADKLGGAALREIVDDVGVSKHIIKYDTMIIATAARHQAEVLVTMDDGQIRLCRRVGFKAARPSEYCSRQGSLALEAEGESPAEEPDASA